MTVGDEEKSVRRPESGVAWRREVGRKTLQWERVGEWVREGRERVSE